MSHGLRRENVDTVLAARALLNTDDKPLYKLQHEPLSAHPYVYSDELKRFISVLRNEGFVSTSFEWATWREHAQQYIEDPEKVASASLTTIQRLFTLHVRLDRFNGGHFAEMLENSHIEALLDRLAELRDEL